MKTKFLLTTTLIVATTASVLVAQDGRPQRPGGNGQQGQQGRPGGQGGGQRGSGQQGGPGGMQNGQRPPFPLIDALDANHDGTIDAQEIANASAALKKLDKNGDGKLTRDEFLPARPPGMQGGQGQGGQSGQGAGGPPQRQQ